MHSVRVKSGGWEGVPTGGQSWIILQLDGTDRLRCKGRAQAFGKRHMDAENKSIHGVKNTDFQQ